MFVIIGNIRVRITGITHYYIFPTPVNGKFVLYLYRGKSLTMFYLNTYTEAEQTIYALDDKFGSNIVRIDDVRYLVSRISSYSYSLETNRVWFVFNTEKRYIQRKDNEHTLRCVQYLDSIFLKK